MPLNMRHYGESEHESSALRCMHITNFGCIMLVIGVVCLVGIQSTIHFIVS